MDIRKLQRAIVDGLEDVKAQNIQVFNTEHLSPLFERVIVASGTSNRQTKALAASVRDAVKSRGMAVMRTEGEDNGEWIIVDCGAAVVHVMQPAIRDYYRLEEIWGEKPVRMKVGDGKVSLPKASEEPAVPATAKTSRSTTTRRVSGGGVATKTPATRKAPAKTAAKPAAKAAPAKAPAKTTAKSAAGKAVATKAPPRARAPKAETPAAKAPAPRRVSGGTATAKSAAAAPAAKRAPARKTAAPTAARKTRA